MQQNCLHFPGSSKNKHSRTCLSSVSPPSFVLLFARLFLAFTQKIHWDPGLVGWVWVGLRAFCSWKMWGGGLDLCWEQGALYRNISVVLSRVWGLDHSLCSFSSAQSSSGKNLLLRPNLTLPDTTGNTHQIPSPRQLYFLWGKKKNRDKKPHFHQEHLIPFPPTSKGKTNRYFM